MRRHHVLVAAAALVALSGCRAEIDDVATLEAEGAASYAEPQQLLGAAMLDKYRKAAPKVAYPALQAILSSSRTLWYDKEVMKPAYQDSVGDGSYTPIGARFNNEGKSLIVPEGKRLFSDDGETWSFPFGHTAGIDEATNVFVSNFIWLPEGADGKTLPVVYSTVDDNSQLGGLGLHRWTWMYPKGTVLGEVLMVKDSAGALHTVELRTRTRFLDGWAANSYRPFATATGLAAAIKAKRSNWASTASLKLVVDSLENNATLQAKSKGSPDFNNIVELEGATDTLPDFGDESLVRELLTETAFVSAYGEAWKTSGNLKNYMPTTSAKFSIVPTNNFAGMIEVSDKSCMRCHQDAGRIINDFEPQAVLYGDIWGSDKIFSFHPYDQTRIGGAGQENRAVRPGFASGGIVQRYEQGKHPSDLYKKLAGP